MNREALTQAIRVMQSVHPDNFDMTDYYAETICKTTACIAGHCAMDPWFVDNGFVLKPHIDGHGLPTYGDHWSYMAVRTFFDLDYPQTMDLFYAMPAKTPTPAAAIARLQALLAIPTL